MSFPYFNCHSHISSPWGHKESDMTEWLTLSLSPIILMIYPSMMVNKTLHSELLRNIKYDLNEKRIIVTHLFAQHLLYVHCSMECLKRSTFWGPVSVGVPKFLYMGWEKNHIFFMWKRPHIFLKNYIGGNFWHVKVINWRTAAPSKYDTSHEPFPHSVWIVIFTHFITINFCFNPFRQSSVKTHYPCYSSMK